MALAGSPGSPGTHPEILGGLLDAVRRQRPDADLTRVQRAYELAEFAHAGQTRSSGLPYIHHPVEVAKIVVDLKMDEDSIVAALLHDVVEDTLVSVEQIEKEFGPSVRDLVDGVTKLELRVSKDASDSRRRAAETVRAAETLRKMLMAMAKDIRVIVVKLADRLHNMQTLEHLPRPKQIRIANETLDIFAPLAARLGIWQMKWQLEDLCFRTLHPDEFARISALVQTSRANRDKELESAMTLLKVRLEERGLKDCLLMGRSKHLYSIFNKVNSGVPFEEIYDLTAIRILTNQNHECYLALGVVHDLWVPMKGLFFDYIGSPKPNGYQSIHTKVLGPQGSPLEVQIRTKAMHETAEYGVAAHWSYKEGRTKAEDSKELGSLRQQLFDWSSDARTSSDYLRTVTQDLFGEQVFVFTPKGDVLDLPAGATPLDFAFRLHTNLGLKTVGAKVNGVMATLATKLQNGDVVEVLASSRGAHPNLDWLKLVQSQHAKSKIRAFLRKEGRSESAARGRDAIEKELRRQGMDPKAVLSEEALATVASRMRTPIRPEDIFSRVGEGLTAVQSVVSKLRDLFPTHQEEQAKEPGKAAKSTNTVAGALDGVAYRRGKCCGPIPGDDVTGYVSRGRGIVIHRAVCPNLLNLIEQEPERILPMEWVAKDEATFPVAVKITCFDRHGLLHDITTVFAEGRAGVVQAKVKTLPNHSAEINFTVSVRDIDHLRQLLAKIAQLQDVISILRTFGKG